MFRPLCLFILLAACSPARKVACIRARQPLQHILTSQAPAFDSILGRPEVYEVQIIYTQIDRDKKQRPHFRSWYWNTDSSRYFYPASTVKMPLAFLALEKINRLQRQGYPRLHRECAYRLDSLLPFQQPYRQDPTAPGHLPTIAHDIRQIFAVSDNLAYNHLFDFLGRDYINRRLRELGYSRTGIVHRFQYPGRDNRFCSPIQFYDEKGVIYEQGARQEDHLWKNPQHNTLKGKGYFNSRDSLVLQPFDMSGKNWFALTDMEKMLRAVWFPETVPAEQRFDLTEDDYAFLRYCMGMFPRECPWPRYDTSAYYDGYVKFLAMGDSKQAQDGALRSFNKVGEAYGVLTDVAYIADQTSGAEFILAATILCNPDGIFNDDRYSYDETGYPFLGQLGRAVLEYEKKRRRKVRPDWKWLPKF